MIDSHGPRTFFTRPGPPDGPEVLVEPIGMLAAGQPMHGVARQENRQRRVVVHDVVPTGEQDAAGPQDPGRLRHHLRQVVSVVERLSGVDDVDRASVERHVLTASIHGDDRRLLEVVDRISTR